MKNKSVIVVGGAGYLGSVLVPQLIEHNYDVTIIDRGYFGLDKLPEGIDIIREDMRSISILPKADAIINIGGLSNDPTAEFNEQANYEMNTNAAVSLAKLAKIAKIPRYIYASSASVYDIGIENDTDDIVLDETAEVEPTKPYSRSKWLAEKQLFELCDDSFSVTALRKGTLYGYSPRMRYDLVVNAFVKDAITKGKIILHDFGSMWRPLVHVADAARAYIAMIEAPFQQISGNTFNVVDKNYRISELALYVQSILQEYDICAEISCIAKGKPRNYRISGEKIKTVTQWEPKESLENSIIKIARHAETVNTQHPRYYNIEWMTLLEEAGSAHFVSRSIFSEPR